MYRNRMKWIEENKPHRIQEDEIKSQIKTGKAFFHGHDREGRPILIIRAANHIPSSDEEGKQKDLKFMFYMIELGMMLLPAPPNNQFVVLYDRINFSRRNFDPSMLTSYSILGMYYPEMIHSVHILRANWLFTTLRAIAAQFLDPVFMQKLQVWNVYDVEMRMNLPKKVADEKFLLRDHGGTSIGKSVPYYPASVPSEFLTTLYGDIDGIKPAEQDES
jgi:hypothetical protein